MSVSQRVCVRVRVCEGSGELEPSSQAQCLHSVTRTDWLTSGCVGPAVQDEGAFFTAAGTGGINFPSVQRRTFMPHTMPPHWCPIEMLIWGESGQVGPESSSLFSFSPRRSSRHEESEASSRLLLQAAETRRCSEIQSVWL